MEQQLRFLVGIPIPSLDRNGNELGSSRTESWTRKIQASLTRCFGGATALQAPGTNVVDAGVLYEEGQTLVLSACRNRKEFRAKRRLIKAIAARMGEDLDQESVFVLAFDSDSFLIEMEQEIQWHKQKLKSSRSSKTPSSKGKRKKQRPP